MQLPLSILDLAWVTSGSTGPEALRNTLELARLADRMGYTRYWLAEHHNMPAIASSAPEIMIGQVARETARIRVGSGGIMLPNHAPLRIAEAFRTLEALFPDRIDLGIGRAPGSDQITALALRRSRAALAAEDFPERLQELFHFGEGSFPADHPFRNVTAMPNDVPLPPVWLLGSSMFSAQLAARLGLGFVFAAHFSELDPVAPMLTYRKQFTPSAYLAEPRAIIAASVICAETEERAQYLARTLELWRVRFLRGIVDPLPTPEEAMAYPYSPLERAQTEAYLSQHFIGTPAAVREQILQFAQRTQADEVMVASTIHSQSARLRSYELLAEAFAL